MKPAATPPASVLAIDAACVAFAAWTVLCNAVVLLGGSAQQLRLLLAVLLAAALAALVYAWRTGRLPAAARAVCAWAADDDHAPAVAPAALPPRRFTFARVACAALGIALVAVYARKPEPISFALIALPYFAAAYALLAFGDRGGAGPAARGHREWLLWLFGLAAAALTLALHRPDTDDTFYANLAVSVVDFPHEPLLSRDTLHGIAGALLKTVAYKASSIELLTGFVSALFGVETIAVYYLWIPALAALLVPLALARLFRQLDGERWLWAVLAVLVLFVLDGGGGRGSFSDFAFPRLFQGKAMFLSVLLPALLAHAVRFGRQPSRARFALLALVQIAALGTSVTAFWAAPLLAVTGTLVGLAPPLHWRALHTLLLAAASSVYLLLLGGYLKLAALLPAAPADGAAQASASLLETLEAPSDALHHAYAMVLGAGAHLIGSVAVVLLTWPLCRTAPARRFAVVVPLAFALLAGNPWLVKWMMAATTPPIHWRVLWMLPVPLLAALAASALVSTHSRARALASSAAFACALAGFLLVVSPAPAIATRSLSAPRLKADPNALGAARALVRNLPPHSYAAAPEAVSRLLPMLNGYSYPLVIKAKYLPSGTGPDRQQRVEATRLLGERKPSARQQRWLLARLDQYRVSGVVAPDSSRNWSEALAQAGFAQRERVRGYAIWTRGGTAARH